MKLLLQIPQTNFISRKKMKKDGFSIQQAEAVYVIGLTRIILQTVVSFFTLPIL